MSDRAEVIVSGNEGKGYTVTTYLPKTWIDQFDWDTRIKVARTDLGCNWGTKDEEGKDSKLVLYFAERESALAEARRICTQIRHAKTLLEDSLTSVFVVEL
jgi:hypothetical protein